MGRRKNKSAAPGNKTEHRKWMGKGKEETVTSFVGESDDSSSSSSSSGDEYDATMIWRKLLVGDNSIVSEIFSRLPPQTLFRFTTISKGLYNFIGEAEFAALHSRNCKLVAGKSITGIFTDEFFCVSAGGQERESRKMGFVNTIDEREAGVVPDPWLEFIKQDPEGETVDILDSCNGLLLCCCRSTNSGGMVVSNNFVCNPLTREKVALPCIPRMSPSDFFKSNKKSYKSKLKAYLKGEVYYTSAYTLMVDLDYHNNNNHLKYKVVCVCSPPCYSWSELLIWFSEIGQWVEVSKKLPSFTTEELDPKFSSSGSRVFFNGSLYWDCLEGHILVCPLNPQPGEPLYYLIDTPPARHRRSLWKSEDKLHCYCQGFAHEYEYDSDGECERKFPEWTLSNTNKKWDLQKKSRTFRNLSDDISDQVAYLYYGQRDKLYHFRIISYAPQSKAFFLLILRTVYIYYVEKRLVEYIGGLDPLEGHRSSVGDCKAYPYVHSMGHIQTPKTAGCVLRSATAKLIENCRVEDHEEAGTAGSETNKMMRGRRNKRTPKCPDFSLVEVMA